MRKTVYCSMATIPERHKSQKIVADLLRGQCDHLKIYDGQNELGDANKFRGVQGEGYMFTVDDDIIYPKDYVKRGIKAIERTGRSVVISFHGNSLKKQPIQSYYEDTRKIHFTEANPVFRRVHIGGTGVMCWHTDLVRFPMEIFKQKNMADIWVGLYCQQKEIPIFVPPKPRGWLQSIKQNGTLWEANKNRDKFITETINSIEWKPQF